MALGLTAALGGLQAISGIIGSFGARRRLRALQEKRERMLAELAGAENQKLNSLHKGNYDALNRLTGSLKDRLVSLGDEAIAESRKVGVTGNTADQAFIAKVAAENAALLAGAHQKGFEAAEGMAQDNKMRIAERQLGDVQGEITGAQQEAGGAMQSLASGLGALQQLEQSRTGTRAAVDQVTGKPVANVQDAGSQLGNPTVAPPLPPNSPLKLSNTPNLFTPGFGQRMGFEDFLASPQAARSARKLYGFSNDILSR